MSYVRKLGASALVIAAAFAVAFAVLMSSPATEAAEIEFDNVADTSVDAQPGDTVIVPGQASASIVSFEIVGGSSTGSFDSGGGQSLSCGDSETGRGCDTNDDADTISVKLNIDADSPDGFIQVSRTLVLNSVGAVPGTPDVDNLVIVVTTQPKPVSVALKSASTTINADSGSEDTTVITATVKYDKTPETGTTGELTFITTLGSFACGGDGSTSTQVCADVVAALVDTNSDGVMDATRATVTLSGADREGTAVITVTHASVDSATAEVTLFGTAKNLRAEAEQGSVEIGGFVLIVLTVTDGAGNPVSGAQPEPGDDEVEGPSDDSTLVATSKTDAFTATELLSSPYNVDKNVKDKASLSIPACGNDLTTPLEDADENPQQLFGDAGTNDKGQCVVKVTAPEDDEDTSGTDEAATRGVHTINFALDKLEASVDIEVAGSPASVEADPASGSYIEPLSDNDITITVRDDEGVLVGITEVEIVKVEGDGLVEGIAGIAAVEGVSPSKPNSEKTSDGVTSFTFTAPLSAGTTIFRIRAGDVTEVLQLHIGSEPVEVVPPTPAAPSLDRQPAVTGFTLVNFTGGSIGELATAVEEACGTGGRVYATDYLGRWVSYIPAAMMGPVNAAFEQLFPDGIPANEPLLVGGCSG